MDESAAIAVANQALSMARDAGAQRRKPRYRSRAVSTPKREPTWLRSSRDRPAKAFSCASSATGVRRRSRRPISPRSGLRDAVTRAVAHADLVAPDRISPALPDAAATDGSGLRLAIRGSRSARASRKSRRRSSSSVRFAPQIRALSTRAGRTITDAVGVTALANSTGFSAAYTWTRVGRSTGPVALDGEVKRIAHYGTAAQVFERARRRSKRSRRPRCVAPSISSARVSRPRCAYR